MKTKKFIPDPNEFLKIYICLELPRKEIEPTIQEIKQLKGYKYWWEEEKYSKNYSSQKWINE